MIDRPDSDYTSEIPIGVDVRRSLEVLSGNVFAGQQACIRELIANAADSIAQLPPESRVKVEIRIIANRAEGALVVSDNGLGMAVSLRQACVVAVWRTAWPTEATCDQWAEDVQAGSSIWR